MEIRISQYRLIVHPRTNYIAGLNDPRKVEESLERLTQILGENFHWVITGGLVIPLSYRHFYRKHGDIDIGVGQSDLVPLAETAKNNGYDLVSRIFMTKIPPKSKVVLYKSVTPTEALQKKPKHLRLIKIDDKGGVERIGSLLGYIDIYVHHFQDTEMICNDDGERFPAHFNEGLIYITKSGKMIRLRSLDYVKAKKERRATRKDRLDLEVLNRLVGTGIQVDKFKTPSKT